MLKGAISLLVIALIIWVFWMTKEHLTKSKKKEK